MKIDHLVKDKKTSIYRGVTPIKNTNKYRARIKIGGSELHMGSYKTETEVAEVFDIYIVHTGKDHVELNFPDKRDEYLRRKYIPYKKNKQTKYVGVKKKWEKIYSTNCTQ